MTMELNWAFAGFALALFVQTGGIVWFLSRMNSRIDHLEDSQEALTDKNFGERLVKLETMSEVIQRQQDEQMVKLDKIGEGVNSLHRFFSTGGKLS